MAVPFRIFFSSWAVIRENIQTVLYKARNIASLEEMKESNLQNDHVMIIHVIKMMNETQVENFINKVTSFIIKWINIYEEAESDSITKIINYFFSTDFTNFYVVFFIGINRFIYSSCLNNVFIARPQQ